MDVFMKVLLLVSGLFFCFVGAAFFIRWKRIIQWVQKRKFGRIAEPRKEERTMAKIVGVLLFLVGVYYTVSAILSFFLAA